MIAKGRNSKVKAFTKQLTRMEQQGSIIDTRRAHIYRLVVDRNGHFCVVQNRYNLLTGIVYDGSYINKWGYKYLDDAIAKFDEIKSQPNMQKIDSTKFTFCNS